MAAQDVSEGDGWWQDQMPAYSVLEAAANGDAQQVRELVRTAGTPLGQIIWAGTMEPWKYAGLKFLLEVCGTATNLNF